MTAMRTRSGSRIFFLSAAMHRVRQALQRGIERCVLLGEAEPHHRGHRILLVEGRYRDRGDLVVVDDALAERLVGFVEPERRKIDREEIRPLRFQHGKADALQPLGQPVPAPRQILAHVVEIFSRLVEAIGHGGLQIGRRGEGQKLVHLRGHAQQRRRGADEADLPSRQRKDLAGAADLDGAVAHARDRDQRDMLAAVEDRHAPRPRRRSRWCRTAGRTAPAIRGLRADRPRRPD